MNILKEKKKKKKVKRVCQEPEENKWKNNFANLERSQMQEVAYLVAKTIIRPQIQINTKRCSNTQDPTENILFHTHGI